MLWSEFRFPMFYNFNKYEIRSIIYLINKITFITQHSFINLSVVRFLATENTLIWMTNTAFFYNEM